MRAVKVLERVLITIPIMLGVAVMVFIFMRLTPGDPVDIMMGEMVGISDAEMDAMRREFNLDKPIPVQLWLFLTGVLRGDLGTSFVKRVPVTDLILEHLPATIELAMGALFFGLIISIPIGILSAVKQYSVLDRASMAGAFLGISMPSFWLGLILILVFSVKLGVLPVQGRIDHDVELQEITGLYVLDSILTGNRAALISALRHLILPSVTLGATLAAIVARVLRSSLVEILRADYITLARAKGQVEFLVIMKHGVRNALIPTVTVVGLQVGALLGGNMVVETVFGWPGLGRLVVSAIFNRDFPLVQGAVMTYAFTYVIANLIVDILYTYLNPKITL
ncbi:MAG TPA: ABC transporter permease [Anaerolineales bacterium]|nr:ABC transporter permease [Anaerolineae bacterium]HIP87784.1 ABC transporter permease [Anaerolineales bacterium]